MLARTGNVLKARRDVARSKKLQLHYDLAINEITQATNTDLGVRSHALRSKTPCHLNRLHRGKGGLKLNVASVCGRPKVGSAPVGSVGC